MLCKVCGCMANKSCLNFTFTGLCKKCIKKAKNDFIKKLEKSQTMKSLADDYGDNTAFLHEVKDYFDTYNRDVGL